MRRFLATAASSAPTNLSATRAVLAVAGKDATRFLNGLLAQDLAPLQRNEPLYSAVLDARGRLTHDVFLHPAPDDRSAVLVDCDSEHSAQLLKDWTRRRLRMKVTLEDISHDVAVVADLANTTPSLPPDARSIAELGSRGILPAVSAPPSQTALANAYRLRRWELGVAEGHAELQYGRSLPLETNAEGLHGVSFEKGCYVGQELTARTHFRGVVRKRVMPFTVSDECAPLAVGTALRRADAAAAASTRRARSDGEVWAYDADERRGLALVRIAAVAEGGPLAPFDPDADVGDSAPRQCEVHVTRPAWWPARWGNEDAEEPRWG